MDTVLTTFTLVLSRRYRTVEVLGSWDNFSRPYKLRRDAARGRGVWTACPLFEDIVFDGDELQWDCPRNGPLKQGGAYWYYYRLDDTEEYCDPHQPTVCDCPLLPGQSLNYLEMPFEILEEASPPAFGLPPACTMTYDPQDRYKSVSPVVVQEYKLSPKLGVPARKPLPSTPVEPATESRPTTRKAMVNKAKSFTRLRQRKETTSPSLVPTTPFKHSRAAKGDSSPDSIATPKTRPPSRKGNAATPISRLAKWWSMPAKAEATSPTEDSGLGISIANESAAPSTKSPVRMLRTKLSRRFDAAKENEAELRVSKMAFGSHGVDPHAEKSPALDLPFVRSSARDPRHPSLDLPDLDSTSPIFSEMTIDTPSANTPTIGIDETEEMEYTYGTHLRLVASDETMTALTSRFGNLDTSFDYDDKRAPYLQSSAGANLDWPVYDGDTSRFSTSPIDSMLDDLHFLGEVIV